MMGRFLLGIALFLTLFACGEGQKKLDRPALQIFPNQKIPQNSPNEFGASPETVEWEDLNFGQKPLGFSLLNKQKLSARGADSSGGGGRMASRAVMVQFEVKDHSINNQSFLKVFDLLKRSQQETKLDHVFFNVGSKSVNLCADFKKHDYAREMVEEVERLDQTQMKFKMTVKCSKGDLETF